MSTVEKSAADKAKEAAKAAREAKAAEAAQAKAEKAEKDAAAKADKDAKAAEAKAAKEAKAKEQAEAKAKRDAEKAAKKEADDKAKAEAKEARVKAAQEKKEKLAAEKEAKRIERENRPKKDPLTLSQRRAMLNLGEKGDVTPKTGFNALPLNHLVSVGLAETRTDKVPGPDVVTKGKDGEPDTVAPGELVEVTVYSLTEKGKQRLTDINPKWRDWKPAATVESTEASGATAPTEA